MSGFCDFCQVWHSASCCHPGRQVIADLSAKLEGAEECIRNWRREFADMHSAKLKLESQLAEARGVALEEAIKIVDDMASEAPWPEDFSAHEAIQQIRALKSKAAP